MYTYVFLAFCFDADVLTFFVDKFKRREYLAPDIASVLRPTSNVTVRPLKPGSSGAKEVRGSVECLSKDTNSRSAEEGTLQRPEKAKEPRRKEKVP